MFIAMQIIWNGSKYYKHDHKDFEKIYDIKFIVQIL